MVRVINGDAILVDPSVYPTDTNMRIRLRFVDAPERGEPGYEEAKEDLKRDLPVGSKLSVENDRVHWTHNRLEAIVERM